MDGTKIFNGVRSPMSKIVIVGGGTAGWMTALYCKLLYSESDITVVASEEIGILGAGESTTPMTVDFLDILKISLHEVIKECGATIKIAAKFSGWNNSGKHYYNPFGAEGSLSISELNPFKDPTHQIDSRAFVYSVGKEEEQFDFDFNVKLAENNLFPFDQERNRLAHFSLNFDASLMAKYLKKIAIGRGINHLDKIVEGFINDENGNICKIVLREEESIDCDFVFDCSGFKRLIAGKHYKAKWKSYKEHLPVDKAFPFFLSHEQMNAGVVPYTNAVAMKYGWMWLTPLQHRYGCGYTFDSSYISVEDAKKEVEEYFGFEVNPPKPGLFFEFDAGCYEDAWIKNSIAIGLSAGFIEPLEATSILSGLHNLKFLPTNIESLINYSEKDIDVYNDRYRKDQQEIVDFIYLHYMCTRNDTDFWKNFQKNNKIPDSLSLVVNKSKERMLVFKDFEDTRIFGLENYLFVMQGNEILDTDPIKLVYNSEYSEEENRNYELFKLNQNNMVKYAISWNQVMEIVNANMERF